MSAVSSTEHRVGPVDAVTQEAPLLVSVSGLEIGIFKLGEELHAYENRCAHQGGPVCTGAIIGKVEQEILPDGTVSDERESTEQIHIVCPWHGWEYDMATGECATDRRFKLRRFPLEVRDGEIFISVEP